jgi:hypothetical protein
MRRPMTTDQAITRFPEDTESSTCSTLCQHCKGRVWFVGSWLDDDVPGQFNCPYCHTMLEKKHEIVCITCMGRGWIVQNFPGEGIKERVCSLCRGTGKRQVMK